MSRHRTPHCPHSFNIHVDKRSCASNRDSFPRPGRGREGLIGHIVVERMKTDRVDSTAAVRELKLLLWPDSCCLGPRRAGRGHNEAKGRRGEVRGILRRSICRLFSKEITFAACACERRQDCASHGWVSACVQRHDHAIAQRWVSGDENITSARTRTIHVRRGGLEDFLESSSRGSAKHPSKRAQATACSVTDRMFGIQLAQGRVKLEGFRVGSHFHQLLEERGTIGRIAPV